VRALIIEDYAILAEATAELLRTAGFEVQIANWAGEGLAMAATFRPDLVLCDIKLPDMSGMDVARALRANPGTADVLIVLHTAMDDTDIKVLRRLTRADEVNLVLSKPLTNEKIDTLLAALAAWRKRCLPPQAS
jgi:CheY-like chemotaxis protein